MQPRFWVQHAEIELFPQVQECNPTTAPVSHKSIIWRICLHSTRDQKGRATEYDVVKLKRASYIDKHALYIDRVKQIQLFLSTNNALQGMEKAELGMPC